MAMNMPNELPPLQSADTKPAPESLDLTVLFMVLVAGLLTGLILHYEKPCHGVNDGSRWNTVYYLVEHGTYEFIPEHGAWWGRAEPRKPKHIPPFETIDMINIPDAEGNPHYYSSKPPFLPTCMAGLVLAIETLTGGLADFKLHPWFMIRTTVILTQIVPFLICIWLIRRHLYRMTESPFVRAFCMAVVTLGTFLTSWSITFNNHVIGAFCAMFALHAALLIWYEGRREWYWFTLAGFFAAFTAASELPAGLFAVALFALLLIKDVRRTLIFGLIGAAGPAITAIYTNYLVTNSILPAYVQVHKKAGWYDYPGSYWSRPHAIDALNEPRLVYLFNMLIGHHGFFLMTPVLAICLIGLIRQARRSDAERRGLAGFVLLLTAAIITVYTFTTNNYGGVSQGFRWLFWLIPLWLLFLSEGMEWLLARKGGRGLCYFFLGVSMISVGCALRAPWDESWIERLLDYYNLMGYRA